MTTEHYPCKSAVLLIVFNRPDLAREVLDSIRLVQPERLYIAADGPRVDHADDPARCAETRKILESIDWKCEVNTQFQTSNLGVELGVKTAIDWFFTHEESGIVLEDDTVPTGDFYRFCDEMLERYSNDDRVGCVCGSNFTGYSPTYASYLFSRDRGSWGWATWSRSWKNMDLDLTWLNQPQASSIRANLGSSESIRRVWDWRFKLLRSRAIETWDWQWAASLAAQSQLAIFPSANLVSNIGFGTDSTHTSGAAPEIVLNTGKLSWPLEHPKYVVPDIEFMKLHESGNPGALNRFIQTILYTLVAIKKRVTKTFNR